jgi:glycosyltransferase involved in cell wall biosynthesis
MEPPKLSVVVPNYNHGKFLPRCLEALLGQSVPPLEVIVIDDASTDNSLEVLAAFARRDPRIRVFGNERNQGVVFGLNRGMNLARGDYLFFPAADDEVKPGLFEKSLQLLGRHPEAALCCTITEWRDTASGLKWHMAVGMAAAPAYLSPDDLVRLGRRRKLIICTSSAIMRKEPLLAVGGFMLELRWHCDWFAVTVPAFRHGICYVPEPLSDFYLAPTSYYNRGRKSAEHWQVLTQLLEHLSSAACADIAERIRDSTILSVFGFPILRLLAMEPKYRQFLTPSLVAGASRRSAELVGRRILPRPIARIVLKLLYSQKPTASTCGA